jgi:ferredoxin
VPGAAGGGAVTLYRVTLRQPDGRETTLDVSRDAFVWDAARAAGLELPHRCLQGWCLSCAARLVSGTVDQSAARRYYAADADAGFVLLCTARPTTDLVLETHAREAMRAARRARRLPYPRGDWGWADAAERTSAPAAGAPAAPLTEAGGGEPTAPLGPVPVGVRR